jgi:hypothetical protein
MFLIVYPQALVIFSFFPHLIIFSYLHLKKYHSHVIKSHYGSVAQISGDKN